jgi:hypothetical protein
VVRDGWRPESRQEVQIWDDYFVGRLRTHDVDGGWTEKKSGLREGNMKGFTAGRIAPRTHKVMLVEPLNPGDYGFFMGTGQQMAMNDKDGAAGSSQRRMYDFSISD